MQSWMVEGQQIWQKKAKEGKRKSEGYRSCRLSNTRECHQQPKGVRVVLKRQRWIMGEVPQGRYRLNVMPEIKNMVWGD